MALLETQDLSALVTVEEGVQVVPQTPRLVESLLKKQLGIELGDGYKWCIVYHSFYFCVCVKCPIMRLFLTIKLTTKKLALYVTLPSS